MRGISLQFFLAFAVMGAVLPFLPVFLQDRGLDRVQIGWVIGIAGVAILITPVLVTLLADARIDARRLMAAVFLLAGVMLLLMLPAAGFWPILVLFVLHNLAFMPAMPLQDGIHFAVQRLRESAGEKVIPYHRVRVWGSVGFIVPALILFWLLRFELSSGVVMIVAAGLCIAGALNTFRMPDPRIRMEPDPAQALPPGARLPTSGALRAMLEPHVLVFCIAMALTQMAGATYYGFYPLYLTDEIGISREWVGMITSIGVSIEVLFMVGFGWLLRRLGFKRLMALGVVAMGLRLGLLALWPNVGVALGIQVLHGLNVIVMHVAAPIFLNEHAEDEYRSSMQGLYTMAVMGFSRIIGSLIAGYIAQASLTGLFAYGAGLCVVAAVLFVLAFHDKTFRNGRTDQEDEKLLVGTE